MIFAILMLMLITACGCDHEWIDATCQVPRTCGLCGKTQGEVSLWHDWLDPDCFTPYTCSVCGLTEGEPLEHEYTEGFCTRCYSIDESYVDYNNYGFIDLMHNNKLCLSVKGFKLGDESYVKVEGLAFKTFYENHTVNGSIYSLKDNLDTVSSCSDSYDILNLDVYEEGGKAQCIYENNDVIKVSNGGSWEQITIYERTARQEEGIVVLKTIDESSKEVWFVSCDSLDFTSIEEDPDEEYGYRIYFK